MSGSCANELARYARWLHRLGYMPGTAGNLSIRLDDGRIMATPTGCSKRVLNARDMVIVNMKGELLTGSREVTSEIGMHLEIYRRREDVQAVVHAHPPIATAFASCGVALDQPLCCEIIMTLGAIPLADYATTGTDAMGESLRPHVMDHDAMLLANHGAVTYGKNIVDAALKMETLEHFAQVVLAARQIGTPKLLGQDDIGRLYIARAAYLERSMPRAAVCKHVAASAAD
ncbi:MAG TPA: class II aldolase/adducin family protein [Terriglobales bacterium]|jgi:L-fuculose-phosphate aldolase